MKVIKFDEKDLRERVKQEKPKYLFMNGNTLTFISQSMQDPFVNFIDAGGYAGRFCGVKIISTATIPFGEIVFGVE